jgi:hypothetical protein
MKSDQFRRLALALPEVVEGAHHDHPDFRAHGRVFASLHPDGAQAMVKVPPDVQQRLVASGFAKPASGAWGRAGCTMLVLADVQVAVVREALTEAWQFAAASAVRKPARKAAVKRRAR